MGGETEAFLSFEVDSKRTREGAIWEKLPQSVRDSVYELLRLEGGSLKDFAEGSACWDARGEGGKENGRGCSNKAASLTYPGEGEGDVMVGRLPVRSTWRHFGVSCTARYSGANEEIIIRVKEHIHGDTERYYGGCAVGFPAEVGGY